MKHVDKYFRRVVASEPVFVTTVSKKTKYRAPMLGAVAALTFIPVLPAAGQQVLEEVVVKGFRSSLFNATEVKRNADQVVDAISDYDLGLFADQNVAESLQRVTGVAITRNRGIGQRISVRGLGPEYNTVLINGRLMATDEAGREFNFDLLPSELISGAEVVKSPTASTTEGSIGASINIKTARPLDYGGYRATASLKQTFNKLAGENSPEMSGVISNTFLDGAFGALLSFAYRNEDYRSDAYHPAALENTYGRDADYDYLRQIWRPDSQRFSLRRGERKRVGLGGALQWQADERLSIDVDGLFSRYEETETQLGVYIPIYDGFRADDIRHDPASLTFAHPPGSVPADENTILSATSLGRTPFGPLDGNARGQRVDVIKRIEPRFTDSWMLGLNLRYALADSLTLNADISQSRAKLDGDGNRFYNAVTGFNGGQATYRWAAAAPPSLTFTENRNFDASKFRTHYTDVRETSITDEIDAYKFTVDWTADKGVLASVQAGIALSSRAKQRIVKRAPGRGANSGYISDIPDDIFAAPTAKDDFLNREPGDYPRVFPDFDAHAYVAYLETLQPGNQYTPVLQPGSGFLVEEDTQALFVQMNLEGQIAAIPWRANLGVRQVKTEVTSSGVGTIFRGYTPPFGNAAKDNTDPILDLIQGAAVRVENNYEDALWSGNIRFDLSDALILRAAAARVLTRPTLTDLSTAITFNRLLIAQAGNPRLQPYRGNQYDLSLEWYPNNATALSAALFRKDLSSFVSKVTQNENFVGADGSAVSFETTRPRNGEDATINGLELALLHSFDYLPGLLGGLGVQASLTLIDSESEFDPGLSNKRFSIEGLSDQTFSVIAFHDLGKMHSRISYTRRSDYLNRAFGGFGQPEQFAASGHVDLSLLYDITDYAALTFEAINLTNTRSFMYQVTETRVRDIEYNDRRYSIGLRISF